MQLLAKENLLIAVAITCLVIYYYRQQLKKSEFANSLTSNLPVIGGLAFGFNTLINLTK